MWLQEAEFKNPDLLCIEIPKVIEEMSRGLQKLIIGGDDCLPQWKRKRPIAYIMSSDAKRIHASEDDNANYIGFRSTWIKMSRPSIESLRQAFLDRESRIRFGEECPDLKYTHSRLISIEVDGATFYKAHPLYFSKNLNCIIGSRGTGKSTLVDYIRVALDQLRDQEIPKQIKEDIEKRINDTLAEGSKIEIVFEKDGVPFRIEYLHDSKNPTRRITNLNSGESDPNWEIGPLFNIKILSQRQIDYSVDDKNPQILRGQLDSFIKEQLNELKQRILEKEAEIKQLEIKLSTLKEKQKIKTAIETEKSRLEATLSLLDRLREPLEKWQGICKEKEFLEALFQGSESIIHTITAMLTEMAETDLVTFQKPKGTLNKWIIDKASNLSKSAYKLLVNSIENAVEAFRYRMIDESSSLKKLYYEKWIPIYENEEKEFKTIKEELENKGDNPDLYLEYKKQLEVATKKLNDLDREAEIIKAMEGERNKLLNELRELWKEETKVRKKKAEELMASLRIKEDGKPLVEINVLHQREMKSIMEIMSHLIKDKRRLKDEDISLLLQDCLKVYCDKGIEDKEQTFPEFLFEQIRLGKESEILCQSLDRRLDAFLETFTEPVIRELEIQRIPDLVEYKVYRQDGSLAGSIDKVSVGQRGLAFLNLLLASGNEPIIIDTPEEGLDNEGVYQELVPIFRREKEKRQIIVVTHNANIPVNADAELIVALEAVGSTDSSLLREWLRESGIEANKEQLKHLNNLIGVQNWEIAVTDYYNKLDNCTLQRTSDDKIKDLIRLIQENRQVEGKIRRRQESPEKPLEYCNGALDCRVVKIAVQDIMEGSEMAFTKRKEKYGF